MSLLSIYWILRAVDHIFLLLVILFLTWYLYLYTRNTNRLQDESDSENQTVDTETDSSNVNSSRDEGSDVINKKGISSQQDERWHQERERMIQQFKDERDNEIAKLKQLIESKKTESQCESTDKFEKLQDNIQDMDRRIMKLETSGSSGKQTKDSTSIKIQEKQFGQMLEKDYHNIRTNLMYLIENIQDPTRLCLSLFSSGVFDRNDVEKIKRCLQHKTSRDASEKLLFVLLDSGRNSYQPFLKCLAKVGYNQVIERLQQTQGESNNQHCEELRLIEEREALMEWVNEKEKGLRKAVKEKEHDLQMLQRKNESINMELDELRKKMAKMENEQQREKDEKLQEISRLREREGELLKNHEEIRENQQRILNQIKNLESRVEDLKTATISRENELPNLQSDITNLVTLLQKTATAEGESTTLEHGENLDEDENIETLESTTLEHGENLDEDENIETLDVCSHGNSQQQIHPVISTVSDLGSTAEAILGCNTDEEQNTTSRTRTNFLTLDDACLKGDLNNLKDLIESGHNINKRYARGMTPILYCSQSQIEPVSKIKIILDKGGNIDDINKNNSNMLHLACRYGRLETVQYLLDLGLDVHSRGFNGRTPILKCSESQIEPVSKIKMILDKGGNIDDINKNNNNMLHLACIYGCLDTVQYLLDLGLDVHSRGFNGRTPILYCSESQIEPVSKIKMILDKGGNIDDISKNNNNMLHLACIYGRLETVQYLLDLGLDVHSRGFNGLTPILYCSLSQIEPVSKIKIILDKGGNIDDINKNNSNMLHLACIYGCLDTVQYLLDLRLDVHSRGFKGLTPILHCSLSQIEPVSKIKMILDNGGKIDDINEDSDNMLHLSCRFGRLETVQYLLDLGLDVHSRGFNGPTPILNCSLSDIEPISKIKMILDKGGNIHDIDEDSDNMLHLACICGRLETVQYLLDLGLDVHSRGFNGRTPILKCSESQIEPVSKIKMILDKGGNIDDRDTNNNNMLHLACIYGCLDTVQYLLDLGLDVHSRGFNGATPILYCSLSDIEPISKIKIILDKGGNIDDIDRGNDNMLHLGCKYGRLETVQCLLDLGLDVHSRGFNSQTPILYCSESQIEPVSKIKMILDNGGNIDDIDENSDNMLHLACTFGRLETVQYLLDLGLDVHSRGFNSQTPILYCSESQIEPVSKIKMILDNGGNIDDIDENSDNMLHLACTFGRLETVQYLLDLGLDVHSRGFNSQTPILYCSESQIEPVSKIKMILDNGGNIDDIDEDSDNMLHLACTFGRLETVQYLLDLGLDVHSRGFNSQTPILHCSESEIEPVSKIKMILDNGGNIDDIDEDSNNMLHLACTFGRLETVQYLLDLGLDVHSRGFNSQTPILYCSESQIEPVSKIKMIIDNGGNIDDIDEDSNNMLHLACIYGCLDTVQYLLDLGLDVKSINRSGKTPVDCCRYSEESDEKIKLLEEKLKL
ncbi:ankyrin-3 isoform X2 [Patella vulgata]|uniref:ankyrin-3 isoform X2 n=1 Tax=Patella vulgata TaxID=6465 RepID=UPI0024A8C36B|nr:ankyrin-3 isoform X2 [Patella vulgata]